MPVHLSKVSKEDIFFLNLNLKQLQIKLSIYFSNREVIHYLLTLGSLKAIAKLSSRSSPSSCIIKNNDSQISAGRRRPRCRTNRRRSFSSTLFVGGFSSTDDVPPRSGVISTENLTVKSAEFDVDRDVDSFCKSVDEVPDDEVDGFDVSSTLRATSAVETSSSARPIENRHSG